MTERMSGVETEFALVTLGSGKRAVRQQEGVQRLLELARTRIPNISTGNPNDLFLQNGARLYIDCGRHSEYSTPECENPWDVVRHILAGERLLASLLPDVPRGSSCIERAILLKHNVDYTGAQTTWGCHESHAHRSTLAPREIARQNLPFLASRLVLTGAGGFNPFSPGLEFTISPRVYHLVQDISESSTSSRGVEHTKQESLAADGWRRKHNLSSESLCSETAMWLRDATQRLVLLLIEEDLRPGEAVQLPSAVEAMRSFASDTDCQVAVRTIDGKYLRAVDIQRHYLQQVEDHIDDGFMPSWAEEACHVWRSFVDTLETDPWNLTKTLDYSCKRALYEERLGQHGIPWETLGGWNKVLAGLGFAGDSGSQPPRPRLPNPIRARRSSIPQEVERLAPEVQRDRLTWEDIDKFLAVRAELLEMDMRFGEIGGEGLFSVLDRAGALAHHFPGVDKIGEAMTQPPSTGRARVRGNYIGKLSSRDRAHHECYWDRIVDRKNHRYLDLSDPFCREESWRDAPSSSVRERRHPASRSLEDIFLREMQGSQAMSEWLRMRSTRCADE